MLRKLTRSSVKRHWCEPVSWGELLGKEQRLVETLLQT